MSAELIAIPAVGVAVAGIALNDQRTARQEIKELRREMGERLERLDKRIDDLAGRLRAVEHGLAKLEGLREAIAGRSAA